MTRLSLKSLPARFFVSSTAAAFVLTLAACGDGSGGRASADGDGADSFGDGDGDGDGDTAGTGDGDGDGDGDLEVTSIRIEPETVLVEVVNGTPPSATPFTVFGTTAEGDEVPLGGATWSFDRADIGTISSAGSLTVNGELGGLATVSASYGGYQDTSAVTVKLVYDVVSPDGVEPTTPGGFDGAVTADPTVAIAYPYDATVFPRGLASPTLQWNGGNVGDVYRIHAESETFELTAYTKAEPPSRFAFPILDGTNDLWTKLTASTVGDVQVSVQRYDAATATYYTAQSQTWRIADATLTGVIYYWNVNSGTVERIQPGSTTSETFLQPPVPVDVGDGNPNNQCIGCHSVSADGSTLVATTYGSASPWATWDTDGTLLFQSGQDYGGSYYPADASGFVAVSPDGEWVLSGQSQQLQTLKLSAKNSTAAVATMTLPGGQPGSPVHPTWSPDGTKLAFGLRFDGSWLDFTQSTLWVVDVVTGAAPSFGVPSQISANDVSNRSALIYPTFAPDSRWLAFQMGNRARSRPTVIDQGTGQTDGEGFGDLWLVDTDTGTRVKLDLANGVGIPQLPTELTSANYEPTFMPVSVGGYYWLVFVSERPYGNTLTDTAPLTRRKQLWVTAIDASVDGTVDPSHPAFWLPGQTTEANNMRGYWALNPCVGNGEGCSAGFDCCSGVCNADGVCSDPTGTCSEYGNTCETSADCCEGLVCIGNFCAIPTP